MLPGEHVEQRAVASQDSAAGLLCNDTRRMDIKMTNEVSEKLSWEKGGSCDCTRNFNKPSNVFNGTHDTLSSVLMLQSNLSMNVTRGKVNADWAAVNCTYASQHVAKTYM